MKEKPHSAFCLIIKLMYLFHSVGSFIWPACLENGMSCTSPPPGEAPCLGGGGGWPLETTQPRHVDISWVLSCGSIYMGHGSSVPLYSSSTKEGERELFTGSSDVTIRSWDVETDQPLWRIFCHWRWWLDISIPVELRWRGTGGGRPPGSVMVLVNPLM